VECIISKREKKGSGRKEDQGAKAPPEAELRASKYTFSITIPLLGIRTNRVGLGAQTCDRENVQDSLDLNKK
jgi:hypothetical protein